MGQDLHKHSKVSGSYESVHLNKINLLQSKSTASKLSEKELRSLVKLFYNLADLSPQHNYITRTTFEHYFPLGGILAKRLFVAFDTDKDGLINLQEFLDGMALCLQGSADEKYKIAFDMFDLDGSNGVSPWELHVVLKSVLVTAARLLEPSQTQQEVTGVELDYVAHRIVQDAFKQQVADLNGENKMTLKVFKTWIEKHPFVLDSIFGQSCLKDKNLQYSRFGNEDRLVVADNGLSSVKKQTWVDSKSRAEEEISQNAMYSGNYATADYLWSPVFAKMNQSKPSKRYKLAACLVYDSIYMYGGRGICTSLKDMWRYDIGENTWFPVEENGTNRPSYLQEHTMLAYKDSLVVFGGEFTSLNETPLWFFNLHTSSWSKPSDKQKGPVNRRGHTAVISGEVMYVFGGYIDLRGASRELWKYEFSSNTWTREKSQSRDWPSPRYSHSAAVFEKSMVIFGGLEEMQCRNDIWLWNIASCKWTRIKGKNSPPPLFGHSAVKVGDGMLVFGGESSDGTLFNSLWRFDFDTRSWNTITPKGMISPSIRSYHSVIQIPHFLYTLRRPTSSHSAPPCTPRYDRELPRLEEESENVIDVEKLTKLTSVASLGSLDSTALLSQTDGEVTKIKLYPTGSLDSLITTKVLRETENMSLTNHDRTCMSDETLNGTSQEDSYKENTKPSTVTTNTTQLKPAQRAGQSLAIPRLREQFKPQSADHLSLPMSSLAVYHTGSLYSVDDAEQRSAAINIMVLGGTSKRGIESVDRWIDMWKCQIDPKKQESSVKRIEVQSTSGTQYSCKTSYDSTVAYVNFNVIDNANDNDDYDDSDEGDTTITDCVLMDLSEGDINTNLLVVHDTAGRTKSLAPISI